LITIKWKGGKYQILCTFNIQGQVINRRWHLKFIENFHKGNRQRSSGGGRRRRSTVLVLSMDQSTIRIGVVSSVRRRRQSNASLPLTIDKGDLPATIGNNGTVDRCGIGVP
jgi:hypothetical protein